MSEQTTTPVDGEPDGRRGGRRDGRRGGRRYLLEALTIVSSIVLALLLDALWDYRGDRVEERQYLVALQEEFRSSARDLAFDQAERARILGRVESLIGLARSGGGDLPVDSLGAWTVSTLNYRFFTPERAVMGDLVSSGNLGLIRSRSLRRALLEYEQSREALAVIEERERRFIAEHLEPFLAERLPLGQYLALDVFDNDPVLPAPPPTAPYRRLLADPEFVGLLLLRWERTDGARRFASSVNRDIDGVLELLDAEASER